MVKLQKNKTSKQIKRQKNCLKKQQTSASLINIAFQDHWINALSFYHFIKYKYRNSRIYNYSALGLSIKTGISPYLVSKYISQLHDQGMVKRYGNSLQFISIYKVKKSYTKSTKKCTIRVNSKHDIKDIKAILLVKYLEFKAGQQVKRIDEKIDRRNLATGKLKGYSYKQVKSLIKKSRNFPIDESIFSDIRYSYQSLANELGISKSTVFRLIKRAKELNKLKVIPGKKKILHTEKDGIPYEMFKAIKDLLPDTCYYNIDNAWYNKLWHSIIIQLPNIYQFIEYKIEPKERSAGQFVTT